MPRAAALTLALAALLVPLVSNAAERCAIGPVISGAGPEHAEPLAEPRPDSTLTVASLNMAGKMKIGGHVAEWMKKRAIDVLFLQEVGQEHGDGAEFMAALQDRMRLSYAYAPATPFETGVKQGLAIVSRYPLTDLEVRPLEYNRLRFRSRCRIALTATVSAPGGSIRIVNVHLDTRINSSRRLEQLTPAIEALAAFEGPQIIGGDLNTMNVGWMDSMWPVPFKDQADAVREELSKVGFETPFGETRPTFKFLALPLKLDWLYFRRLDTREAGVDDVPLSDHRGIWTRALLERP
jgi:endonuclease/exonuclease/phosphatase family metal-dependent hydrolase